MLNREGGKSFTTSAIGLKNDDNLAYSICCVIMALFKALNFSQ
jgi:hypothetical protein